jgi:hypothetical protein
LTLKGGVGLVEFEIDFTELEDRDDVVLERRGWSVQNVGVGNKVFKRRFKLLLRVAEEP